MFARRWRIKYYSMGEKAVVRVGVDCRGDSCGKSVCRDADTYSVALRTYKARRNKQVEIHNCNSSAEQR